MESIETSAKWPVKFEDLKITTQTYVVYSNLKIDLDKFYANINCFQLFIESKKGLESCDAKDGDIVYAQYKVRDESGVYRIDYRGYAKKAVKTQTINVVVINMKEGDKFYNIKIAKSGKLQITGCRGLRPVIAIIKHIISMLRADNSLYVHEEADEVSEMARKIVCFIVCVMSNARIDIPFSIDRDKLNKFVNLKTSHISIFEKSVGYVGVNMKIVSEAETKEETTVDKITFDLYDSSLTFGHEQARYSDYLALYEKPNKKYKKLMNNSFLVFKSGKTIMSGCASRANRKESYEIFVDILNQVQELREHPLE